MANLVGRQLRDMDEEACKEAKAERKATYDYVINLCGWLPLIDVFHYVFFNTNSWHLTANNRHFCWHLKPLLILAFSIYVWAGS